MGEKYYTILWLNLFFNAPGPQGCYLHKCFNNFFPTLSETERLDRTWVEQLPRLDKFFFSLESGPLIWRMLWEYFKMGLFLFLPETQMDCSKNFHYEDMMGFLMVKAINVLSPQTHPPGVSHSHVGLHPTSSNSSKLPFFPLTIYDYSGFSSR